MQLGPIDLFPSIKESYIMQFGQVESRYKMLLKITRKTNEEIKTSIHDPHDNSSVYLKHVLYDGKSACMIKLVDLIEKVYIESL